MMRYFFAALLMASAGTARSANDMGEWKATGYARLDDAAAVPYLTEAGRSRYQEFLKHSGPRAFLICPDGRFSTIYGGSTGLERELNKVRATGECQPYAVNDAVVWKDQKTTSRATSPIVECVDARGRKEFAQECPPGSTRVRDVKANATKP